ncbi:hypothetical protein ACFL1X_13670 [Candidatus Hydrogenedentota bacterium]
MSILTREQFEKGRHFVYRHGDLLTRRRFAYHFEHGSKQAVLDVLACYQNDDGGFGNGLELDLLCPASSGACTESAFGFLHELGINDGPVLDRAIEWVLSNSTDNGDVPHPIEAVMAYPHADWWEIDAYSSSGIVPIAGLLGKMGRSVPEISERAAKVFEQTYIPFPEKIDFYAHRPLYLYLKYADGADKYAGHLQEVEAACVKMLEEDTSHALLLDSWDSIDIPRSLWQSKAAKAIADLQEDGGLLVRQFAKFPWWRPLWTLDLFLTMKNKGLLENMG